MKNMSKIQQVANYEKLVSFCNAQGSKFNPSNQSITCLALSSLLDSTHETMAIFRANRAASDDAVITRRAEFANVPKLMTRIINTMAANGASKGLLEKAYSFSRKFTPKAKVKADPSASQTTVAPPKTRSTAELDFA